VNIGGLRVIISDYAPIQNYYIDADRGLMIISEDNMRKLIWALNRNNFDVALEEVCHFVKERLLAKIDRKFSYSINDIPRLMKN